MRFHYTTYPEAQERINSTGLQKRIEKVRDSKNGFPYLGHTMVDEVSSATKEMVREGYFIKIPERERKSFMRGLNEAFKDMNGHPWRVHRGKKVLEETPELEDFYLMTGWLPSFVLNPGEIRDYKKFGFSSISGFVGAVGAVIWSCSHGDKNLRGGYEWETKTPEGRTILNNITGDSNLDLRIYQTDMTPDRTIDPLGNEVLYRPELEDDRRTVAAYHSTESAFLVGILKYIEQQKIPSEMLEEGGKPLIEWTKSIGHTIGLATECFGDSGGFGPLVDFGSFEFPLPILDENHSTDQHTFCRLGSTLEYSYGMYVGPNEELIFSPEGRESKSKKTISVCFQPGEVDHLLRGICYQAAKGLGRTVPEKLMSLIEYRFSGQLEKDMARVKRDFPTPE